MRSYGPILILMFFSGSLAAHPIKMSTGKISFDSDNKALTLTINFFQDDFGDHLKKTYRLRKTDFTNPSAELKEVIGSYVNSRLTIKLNSAEKKPELLSVRLAQDNVVQVKLGISGMKELKIKTLEIYNELLFEVFPDQVNIMHIDLDGDGESSILKFFPGDAHKVLRVNFQCN